MGKERVLNIIKISILLFTLSFPNISRAQTQIIPDIWLGNREENREEVLGSLIQELEKQGESWEIIEYDATQSVSRIQAQIQEQIQEGSNLVGYGAGGILLRSYLDQNSTRHSRVVFVGVPHQGTLGYIPLFTKSYSYHLHSWERVYWDQSVPLMSAILSTELPLEKIASNDKRLEKYQQEQTKSIISSLGNQAPTNTQVTNIIGLGHQDMRHVTASTITTDPTPYPLGEGLYLTYRKAGDGYSSSTNQKLRYGEEIEVYAEHENLIHASVNEILIGLGLNRATKRYYPPLYSTGEYEYPKSYHALQIELPNNQDSEFIDWGSIEGLYNTQIIQEGNRLFLYQTLEKNQNQSFQITLHPYFKSHQDQDIPLRLQISTQYGVLQTIENTLKTQLGQDIRSTLNIHPNCSITSCDISAFTGVNGIKYHQLLLDNTEKIHYPVILIHGILGSINTRMLFSRTYGGTVDIADAVLQGLTPIPDNLSTEQWYKVPGIDVTWDSMEATLQQNAIPYRVFSYDWREPNQKSAAKLREYIQRVKREYKSQKVNVIAHSMGGIVTRLYIEGLANPSVEYTELENIQQRQAYNNDIAHFVMGGTPNQGSASAIPRWYGGDVITGNFNPSGIAQGVFLHSYLQLIDQQYGLFQDETNKYTIQREVPSTRDLLPVYPDHLYTQKIIPIGLNLFNRERYPITLYDNHTLRILNLISEGEQSNLPRVKILAVAGTNVDTVEKVGLMEENIYLSPWGITHPWALWNISYGGTKHWFDQITGQDRPETGDGTVLKDRALYYNFSLKKEYKLEPDHGETFEQEYDHISLYNHPQLIRDVLSFIHYPEAEIVSVDPDIFPATVRTLSIAMYSPAEIEVIQPDGKIINQTNIGIGQYLSQGETRHKVLQIPIQQEGEYNIRVIGTGEGVYTVRGNYYTENRVSTKEYTGTIQTGEIDEYTLSLQDGQIVQLEPKAQYPPGLYKANEVHIEKGIYPSEKSKFSEIGDQVKPNNSNNKKK